MSYPSKLILALAFSLFGTTLLAQPQQVDPQQQQLYMQMMQASQQIQQLQQQAFDQSDELSAQRDDLIAMIDDRMIEIDPAAEGLISKRDELIETLQAVEAGDQSQAVQDASAEYQTTMQELQQLQQQALQDSAIQTKQAEVQQSAMQVMEEIDPNVETIIARFNDARMQLMQMQQQ
jgi:paraquat-inducible protein B